MPNHRRDFLKTLITAGALPGLFTSPAAARAAASLFAGEPLDQEAAQSINPEFDAKSLSYWSSFLDNDAEPVISTGGQTRGGGGAADSSQPVFLHYGTEGFQNAAELDPSKLVEEGDVMVSVNTSTIKVGTQDQETFQKLENAQIRVDVAQRTSILPIIEAMAYTVVGGMRTVQMEEAAKSKTSSSSSKKTIPTVQSISVDSDAAWQKMQNIPLPTGEGRWALNLEAQRKDSLFCQVFSNVVKMSGQFSPFVGLPGIALSALNSFNTLYGAMHSRPVQVIQAPPTRVFATQDAISRTGSPGAVTGIVLQSGTYILIPAKQLPTPDQLKSLTVMQGRMVPQKTPASDVDSVAAETLKDVTYVTFDVQVTPAQLVTGPAQKKS
jgi:hypothetical protein